MAQCKYLLPTRQIQSWLNLKYLKMFIWSEPFEFLDIMHQNHIKKSYEKVQVKVWLLVKHWSSYLKRKYVPTEGESGSSSKDPPKGAFHLSSSSSLFSLTEFCNCIPAKEGEGEVSVTVQQ